MKRVSLLVLAALCISGVASASINFTPGGLTPGQWNYTSLSDSSGTFSFEPVITIDTVQGGTVDPMTGMHILISDLTLVNYASVVPGMVGEGDVQGGGIIKIVNPVNDTVIYEGVIEEDSYFSIYATSVMYPDVALDIRTTSVVHGVSPFLDTVNVNDYFDLSLSLNLNVNMLMSGMSFDNMITEEESGNGTFSGTMTYIPEPATMVLLGIGGLLIRKR